jgi:hypothetical protein
MPVALHTMTFCNGGSSAAPAASTRGGRPFQIPGEERFLARYRGQRSNKARSVSNRAKS